MADKLRWGVLSTANIGVKAVIPALQGSQNGEVVGIASRDEARARETADKLGIPQAFGSYEALLSSDDIDAVYIPLPNSLHKEWTLKALGASKHVLCEKPLGVSAAECREMGEAAEAQGLKLMEAFMYRFHPRFKQLQELLQGGAIGEVKLIRSAFSFNARDREDIRWQKDLGGGALYDVGCYCVNVSRTLVGEEPVQVSAFAHFQDGVDAALVGTLRFPSGVLAQFDCALSFDRREYLEVVGSEGSLEMPHAFTVGKGDVSLVEKHGGQDDILHLEPGADKFKLMVEHFADCVLEGKPLRYGVRDAEANLRAIDALYRAARRAGGES